MSHTKPYEQLDYRLPSPYCATLSLYALLWKERHLAFLLSMNQRFQSSRPLLRSSYFSTDTGEPEETFAGARRPESMSQTPLPISMKRAGDRRMTLAWLSEL